MNFDLTDEQRMLQDSLRGMLGRDADWPALADLGVGAALLTPAQGGFGGTGGDIALVFAELGRAGAVTPAIDSCLLGAAILADAGGHDALVADAMAGAVRIAFADDEPGGRYDGPIAAQAAQGRISGQKSLVVGAEDAGWLIVTAQGAAGDAGAGAAGAPGPGLYLVAGDAPGLALRGYGLMDGGRAAEVTLRDCPAVALGPLALADRARAAAILALCAQAHGAMEAAFALTLDHLRTRSQFGRPLASFQALQHRMADLRAEIEQARSAVINLAGHLDTPDRARHVAATKALVGEIALMVARETIQLHGGIGMTEEYPLAAHARRLIATDHRFGDSDVHLARFIAGAARP